MKFLANNLIVLFAFLGVVAAQNKPKDASVQQNAEAVCKAQGADYVPTYGTDGMPTGCKAAPKPLCFFGAYKDPKTGADGCCGKGKGTFITDPAYPKEGACCTTATYSFDPTSSTGGCCDAGFHWSYDPVLKVGKCCGANEAISCSCAPSQTTPITPPPPPVPTTCPEVDGWTFTESGVEYGMFCTHGWNQNLGAGTWVKATDIWDCLAKCGQAGPACQGVNFWTATGDCGFAPQHEYPATGGTAPNVVAAIPLKKKT